MILIIPKAIKLTAELS